MKTDAFTKLLLAAVAAGLFWLCSILDPVAKQVPGVIEQVETANRNVESLTKQIANWKLFQSQQDQRHGR